MKKLPEILTEGLSTAGLNLPVGAEEKLLEYLAHLQKWSAVHNLTAIREPADMVTKHVLDSLVLSPYLIGGRILDVGTGAGLPGIPLALSRPEQSFVLLDSSQKKITFVEHMILSLKLTNVVAVCMRVEKYQPSEQFDWIVSRAFASLSDFVRLSQHLCKKEGKFIAMKGSVEQSEIAAVPAPFTVEKIEPIQVPGLNAARTFVVITRNNQGGVQPC